MSPQRQTELDEMVFSGPFGGIQSETARRLIENSGFQDALNLILLDGQMQPFQALTNISVSTAAGPILGIFDFYNFQGNRISGVFTSAGPIQWNPNGPAWVSIICNPTLSGSNNLFTWAVVAGKLCFSQGVDTIYSWDGTTASATPVSSNAVPAFHLGELNTHLIACPTVESGALAPQRLRWTGAGDPTDWTSFDSGQSDLFNDLGPIRNWKKIYQQGYIFQQWGIVQQVPTGNAVMPWDFVPLSSKSKGLYFPWTLTGYGEFAIYVGKDNVYIFDGSSSQPIGEMPLQGRSWIGARDRILADLMTNGDPNNVYGYYTTSTAGNEYEVYILVIPTASIWIYSMKESNWTRINLTGSTPTISTVGAFHYLQSILINQLVGPISSQNWTFDSLGVNFSGDSIAFGGSTNGYVGLFDFSGNAVACSFTTGSLCFGDTRHSKNVRRVRLSFEAYQSFDLTIMAQNEQGQTQSQYFVIPANTGTTSYQVFPFHIPGVFITFTFNFNTTVIGKFACSEIAIGYDMGAEVRTQ